MHFLKWYWIKEMVELLKTTSIYIGNEPPKNLSLFMVSKLCRNKAFHPEYNTTWNYDKNIQITSDYSNCVLLTSDSEATKLNL